MRLRFFGAAGEVTGSCTLLETDRARVLIDFGMHQGGKEAERHNRRIPPLRAPDLDAVLLTHAHLDHVGRMPLLASANYRGKIFATPASVELAGIILEDAAHIQEMDADRENRKRERRGAKFVKPLYTTAEAQTILKQFRPLRIGEASEIAPGVTARFTEAGHILGSASLVLTVRDGNGKGETEKTIVFSGDIGPKGAPLLRDPEPPTHADLVVLESTYGDRDHRPMDATLDEMHEIFLRARTPQGKVLIPSFAVGRTQNLVYHLNVMRRAGLLDHPRVFVDSPMAIEATDLYRRHRDLFDDEAWAILKAGEPCLSYPGLSFTRTPAESMAINRVGDGAIVLSASGMCTGGRILHHLKHGLWRPETHVVFVGYQGEGTLGRRLVDGADMVRIMGEPVKVNATIHTLGGLSAHAGQSELVQWTSAMAKSKPRVVLNHGEDRQRRALADKLQSELGLKSTRPNFGEVVTL